MKVSDIQIPLPSERNSTYRFFEILPGALSWLILALPFIISLISPLVAAYAITIFLLVWFVRSAAMTARTLQAYRMMKKHQHLDWQSLIDDFNDVEGSISRINSLKKYPYRWHKSNLLSYAEHHKNDDLKQSNLYHAIVIPFHREGREILQPSMDALASSKYDMKRVIIVLTAEERAGPESGKLAYELAKEYSSVFAKVIATVHPADLPDEIKGKGPNANWGTRKLHEYAEQSGIPSSNIVVTSLDCDHRVDRNYFNALTYFYLACPDRRHTSFQPLSMFTNNIWDVPMPMRVIATGNSFWFMIVSMRQHILRNFASHAQALDTMVDTDYYTTRSVVEDGHQFWRTYFRYEGKHEVFPLFTPIYQDAVLAGSLWKTIKEQFIQLKRWAYGASDVAYVAYTGFFKHNNVPKVDLIFKFLRLLEGHVSWATTSLILLFGAFIPIYANPSAKETIIANQLPEIASRIQQVALIGIIATLFISIKLLPPKPAKYSKWRYIPMTLQWLMMPITSIVFSSSAAIYSQTRLMFKKYMDVFDATIKVVKKD